MRNLLSPNGAFLRPRVDLATERARLIKPTLGARGSIIIRIDCNHRADARPSIIRSLAKNASYISSVDTRAI